MITPKITTIGAGRFAPTPTGRLHLGNIRTALLAWLWARAGQLRNILRIEDLDPTAIPRGILEGQYTDLAWLGLRYDESPQVAGPVGPYRQSERAGLYREPLLRLADLGVLYPCWCSRKEVLMAAIAPHVTDEGPVYPGTCRQREGYINAGELDNLPFVMGRAPALRIDVERALSHLQVDAIEFLDRVQGPQRFRLTETMGDFVIRRSDGITAYQLACAYDDAVMGCTQVLRGNDLLPSAARQILLLRLLDLPVPMYAHVGLVVSIKGERLSKRDRAISIEGLREDGMAPDRVIALLARSADLPEITDLDELASHFDVDNVPSGDVQISLGS